MIIDARGFGCPKPVMMAEEELNKIGEGIVEVWVDNEASVKNLSRFASKNSLYLETEKVDNYWKIKLVKGYPCEVSPVGAERAQPREEAGRALPEEKIKKDIFLIISTVSIGKDEALGKTLMNAFLETMKITKELPDTIFLLNEGVKLATVEEPAVDLLKHIEQMGVSIYSCGTCLKHYGLEDKLRAGQTGGMFILIEGIKDFKKVVWI